jgi:hypothetical protein
MNHTTHRNVSPVTLELLIREGAAEIFTALESQQLFSTALGQPSLEQFQYALIHVYGIRGAQGILLRTGRAAFYTLLKNQGPAQALLSTDFRFLPARKKISQGIAYLAESLSEIYSALISTSESDEAWWLRVWDCVLCQTTPTLSCYFTIGILQEFMQWATAGRIFCVKEVSSSTEEAKLCEIRIDRYPLEA